MNITDISELHLNHNLFSGSHLRLEDAIEVKCTASHWNISVNMSLLQMMYHTVRPTDLILGSGKCQGHLDNSFLLFQQSFNTCSTSEKFNTDMNIYKNNLFYIVFDPIRPYVVLKHEWTFIVECDVNANEVTSSHVEHIPEVHNASFTSYYQLSMTYFSDVNFLHRISGNPLKVVLGENVFVKVYTTLPDWDTKMILDTCYTRPSGTNTSAMDVTLIKQGCEVDRNTHIISQSTHETRFLYKDFKYFNNNGGLDMFCNASFCHTSDFSARCTQACTHTVT
ncbi:deleted in malignant brain tumors 1 protein-like [Ruditapes philippinarum]|uniref:deleted in malignant brain tumors 1 protein-like n=1 Tax=Ruditapes philippinarum TaxID=129788 RepID=UPI00295AE003|nr:deleted in malignant brain tumors 1 protein-like [Ruditapes philippinarum]